MKINNKLLSIPPFISTCWSNVSALHMKGSILVVGLLDGDSIEIPSLKPETIEKIFNTHASVLENDHFLSPSPIASPIVGSLGRKMHTENIAEPPFRLTFASMDELGSAMQHNPQQSHAPDLPHEILQKIAAITKIISPEDPHLLPTAEPHCNCMHCQIARAIHQNHGAVIDSKPPTATATAVEEEVKEEDLHFQQWEINQMGSNLFSVTNRLDPKEKYSVHLGKPVGCTCGKEGCEHIIAVLKS